MSCVRQKHPTQRAPDGWESPRFQAFVWLGVGSGKAALSPPAPPPLTLTVSPLDKSKKAEIFLMANNNRIFAKLYLVNWIGWSAGVFLAFYLETFYLFLNVDFGNSEFPFQLFTLSVCILLFQFLIVRSLKPDFNIFAWIAANVKGALLAFVVVIVIGLTVGVYQRPILRFFYNLHWDVDQTDLILNMIYFMVPLFGSISTSTMVVVDIFGWRFGKSEKKNSDTATIEKAG